MRKDRGQGVWICDNCAEQAVIKGWCARGKQANYTPRLVTVYFDGGTMAYFSNQLCFTEAGLAAMIGTGITEILYKSLRLIRTRHSGVLWERPDLEEGTRTRGESNASKGKVEFIAQIRHLVWCGFQHAAGQRYNLDPTPEQFTSLCQGVRFLLDNPTGTPKENHDNWMELKLSRGWKYGRMKDPTLKTHPDLVPFAQLPLIEQMKDEMDLFAQRQAEKLWHSIMEEKRAEGS